MTFSPTDPTFLGWAAVYVTLKWTVGLWMARSLAGWFRRRRAAPVAR